MMVHNWWRLGVHGLGGRASDFGALDRLLLVLGVSSHAVIIVEVLLLKLIEE